MNAGKKNPTVPDVTKINFPGFQEIMDFTAGAADGSVSLTVDSDTDKEYKIEIRNLDASNAVYVRFNNDSGANYGWQYLYNNAGTITANRVTNGTQLGYAPQIGYQVITVSTPTGFIKTAFEQYGKYTSGTTVGDLLLMGLSWNSTSKITSLNFLSSSGNFTAGTRITVYARRSN